MKKLLLSLFVAIVTAACGTLWAYRELREMPDMTWHKSNIQIFEVDIKQAGDYRVDFLFRHVHGFPYKDIGITLQMQTAEDGVRLNQTYTIRIIADNREYLGEGAGDIWDVTHTLLEKQHFDVGKVSFAIAHNMSRDDLQLVMEVGLRLDLVSEK